MKNVLPIIHEVLLKIYLQFADKCWYVTFFGGEHVWNLNVIYVRNFV
jgi:hypothetical protein